MSFFHRKKETEICIKQYDPSEKRPVLKCSICNGEQVAGFQDLHTGAFEEVMLVRDNEDLLSFRRQYGVEGDIAKIF